MSHRLLAILSTNSDILNLVVDIEVCNSWQNVEDVKILNRVCRNDVEHVKCTIAEWVCEKILKFETAIRRKILKIKGNP